MVVNKFKIDDIKISITLYRYQLIFCTLSGLLIAIIILNNYVPFITDEGWKVFNWVEDQSIINSQRVVGWDFAQIYRYYLHPFVRGEFSLNAFESTQMLKILPPLTAVVMAPLGLLSYPRAYHAQVVLLALANFFSLVFIARLSQKSLALICCESEKENNILLMSSHLTDLLLIIVSVLHFLSWGFAYSIEKGNYDAYPMLLIMIGVALMIYKPKLLWLQVFVFSMATHLKIYPAIMFPLLLWQHRQKAILPLIVINLVMALGLGWENFTIWISAVIAEMRSVSTDWPGSSSTGSYIRYMLAEFMPFWASVFNTSKEQIASILKNIINAVVILIWAITALLALRGYRRLGGMSHVLYTLACLGPMMLIPAYSNPYKLIYMTLPILFMLIIYSRMFVIDGQKFAFGVCVGLLLLFGLLSRSQFGFIPNLNSLVIPKLIIYHLSYNKFPLIILIQILVMITTFYLYRRTSLQQDENLSHPKRV